MSDDRSSTDRDSAGGAGAIESEPIAIIGAGLRLPGGAEALCSLDAYWEMLLAGRDAVREVPADRWDADAWTDPDPEAPGRMRSRHGGFLDDLATFDAAFFGISPREAAELDPAQRLLLVASWEALESASVAPDSLERSATGVYVGLGLSDYGRRHFLGPDPTRMTAYSGTGSFLSVAAGRISYTLGLQGPAMTVDTACSSSLVAVHLAAAALRRKEIDLALAGGANVICAPEPSVYFSKLQATSADGRCKAFSADADGYGRGEGVGVVVLKRLSDANRDGDRVLAVVRGAAVNHDGRSNGLTAPNGRAQQEVIRAALADAGLEPESVGYVEAHGTGTPLGDPIEFEALRAVFGKRGADRPLRLGSVKTNLGHLETAAGITGLLKLVLCLQRGEIPPHIHLGAPNPRLNLDRTPALQIPTEAVPWTDPVRVGGVSSFGLSGTNAHVILEAPPARAMPPIEARPIELVALSARSEEALAELAGRWSDAIASGPLPEAARTAAVGRAVLPWRLAVAASDPGEAAARLGAFARGERPAGVAHATVRGSTAPMLAFLLTGQGAQHAGMGRRLYEAEPAFRDALDEVAAAVDPLLGESLLDAMWAPEGPVDDTAFTQPGLFALEVALVRLWASLGVEPDALFGHSVGEIAAAHLAGVMSLSDAAKLVVERGRLMSALPRDGIMVAIEAAEALVRSAIEPYAAEVDVSGANGPSGTVISGRAASVEAVAARFRALGTRVRTLEVSHAFHSPLMEPMLDAFEAVARSLTLRPPRLLVVSDLDGAEAGERMADPGYWRRHARAAVRFGDAIETLLREGFSLFLEIGPRPVLAPMGARCAGDRPSAFLGTLHPDRDDAEQIAVAMGELWARGVGVDLRSRYDRGERRAMPTMPWRGERYWIEPPPPPHAREPLEDRVLEVAWRPAPPVRRRAGGRWRVVGGSGELLAALAVRGVEAAPAEADAEIARGEVDHLVVVAGGGEPSEEAWRAADLARRAVAAGAVVHLVARTRSAPSSAALRGLGRVVAVEAPGRWGSFVDLDGGSADDLADALLADDGEDLVRVTPSGRRVARLVRSSAAFAGEPLSVPSEGTVLVTGGLGGLGRELVRALVDRGARRLVLVGRSGAASEEARALVAELKARRDVAVDVRKADIGSRRSLKALLGKIDDLVGVVHAAGIADDLLLGQLGPLGATGRERFLAVLKAKADSALLLDELTADRELSLFLLVSSASAWVGVEGQASYAAANAVLDALAEARRARGLPAASIALGPLVGTGLGGRVPDSVRQRWSAAGIEPLDTAAAIAAIGRCASGGRASIVVAPFDWTTWRAVQPRPTHLADELAQASPVLPAAAPAASSAARTALVDALEAAPEGARAAMLRDHVQAVASAVLGYGPERRIDPTEGFFDAGMDSLMAMDLRDRLQTSVGHPLPATLVFDHPNVGALSGALLDQIAPSGVERVERESRALRASDEPVAIVGVALRLPGAVDLDALWAIHRDGRDVIGPVPPGRFDVNAWYDPTPGTPGRLYAREGGFVEHIEDFEPGFFRISAREAASLDPQQRMLLECSWNALEDAAISPERVRETQTGVYVGIGPSEYWLRFDPTSGSSDAYAGTGNESSFAAGRLSYVLGTSGPSMSVNTACSSSLVAVHLAVRALREGSCDLALAGGVNAIVGPENTIWMSMLQALAPDGRCKTFDERADGYVRAEGCGMVALKRLSDAIRDGDPIHAVIRGTAVNHDGASSGLTVPNGRAQQAVIRAALADAGVEPGDVGYVECHGTGTRLGDPIEVEALGHALAEGRSADRPLYLGAAKANHGHLEAGAGIAGLLRALLALRHRTVPPIAHLGKPNPALPLDRFPAVRLPTAAVPWDSDGPRFAGVSSFGISGTNAHVLIEEAPERPRPEVATERPVALITVSGRSEAALRELAGSLAAVEAPLPDLAATLNRGRAHGSWRSAVVAADPDGARATLRRIADGSVEAAAATEAPRVVFLCTGAGPQAFGMGKELLSEPVFREALHAAAAAAAPVLEQPLLDVIYPQFEARSPLHDLAYTQPAMFAIEWAMAALWRSWGVEPAAVIGHSTGQYVAACLAGVFDLGIGMRLMAQRARLMSGEPKNGGMVACFASEERILGYLAGHEDAVSVAAVNGPAETVISGRADAVEAVAGRIEDDGIEIRRLNISHAAHSPMMDPILDRFEAMVGSVPLARPKLPLVENVRGALADHDVISPRYWRAHMRQPVRFYEGMRTLVDQGYRVFLEIGNHPVLAGAGARCVEDVPDAVFLPSLRRERPDWEQLLETAGELYRHGARLDWDAFHATAPGQRIALPVTPFQRKRHWVERIDRGHGRVVGADWTYAAAWRPVRPNVDPFGSRGDRPILVLADEGGIGEALAARQHRRAVLVRPGATWGLVGDRAVIDPLDRSHFDRLLEAVRPEHIVHLWALDAPPIEDSAVDSVLPALLSAVHALQTAPAYGSPTVWLVTRGAASVEGEAPALRQAPLLGLGNAAATELAEQGLVRIDLDPDAPGSAAEGDLDEVVTHLELALNTGLREEQIAIRGGRHLVRRLARIPATGERPPKIRSDGTYLVTGGLGALGLRVARWLLEHDAGAVVLIGRQRKPGTDEEIERLGRIGRPDRAVVLLGDVAEPGVVERILSECAERGLPEVRGAVHAAGVLDDGWLPELDRDRWAPVLRPKLDGAVRLHRALPDAELFVLFSSAASLLGNPGQANYAAANAFLDALAAARRAVGKHAVSLCWGPWADGGLAADAPREWARSGVRPLPPALAMEVFEQRLGGPEAVVGIVDLDWSRWPEALPRVPALVADLVVKAEGAEAAPARRKAMDRLLDAPAHRRREALAALVAEAVGRILGQPAAEVDRAVGFFDSGMDSLMAVELSKRLRATLEVALPATLAFDHPNVEVLTDWLFAELGLASEPAAAPAPPTAERRVDLDEPIAIIGLSCRMPGGANDPEAFWELLRSGRDPMREVPPERWDIDALYDPEPGTPGRMYVREAGFVDEALVEGFDPEFFGISPREAEILDPQQRMLLEVSYEALERAGLTTTALRHSRTGVFVGVGSSGFHQRFQQPGGPLYADQYAGTGALEAFVSGRVAYALGLRGPNLALNTACSSALVAVHLAAAALRAGEAEAALAGGVHLMLSPENFVYVSQIRALSPTGRCKTFDASADGYGRAEGAGMLVLKRLSDANRDGDPVLAVIRGTAVGHDGPSSGLTVPYGPAQVQVLSDAVLRSGIDPHDVSYLEAHGTGTVLGDPIEVHAVEEVYCRGRTADNPLHLGAVKSNVGHLEVAAGVASVVKMVLALQHREIPPHLHFRTPNPDLDLDAHGIVVDTAPVPWTSPRGLLRCGISAFGLAGTNVHLVLEEAPERPAPARPAEPPPARPAHLLPLSARSEGALRALAARMADRLAEPGADLADIAHSAATTRIPYEHRLALAAATADEARERLAAFAAEGAAPSVETALASGRAPRVAFLFSGQGAQYPGMGRELYEVWPAFREAVDRCAAVLDPLLPRPIREVMFEIPEGDASEAALHDTAYTQPALFVLEVALAALWRSWGVEPVAVLGHSIGQIAAAAVAGAMSVEDGCRMVAERGRLMSALPRDGAMAAVFADEATVAAALAPHGDAVGIAAINHPGETTISGRTEAVDAVVEAMTAAGIEARRLVVSHAFHSPLMAPMLEPFAEAVRQIALSAPKIPVGCNLTGAIATPEQLTDPTYWRDLVRQPVRFAAGLEAIAAEGCELFVEVGPHSSLLAMGRRTLPDRSLAWLPSLRRDQPAHEQILPSLGALWIRGAEVDWAGFDAPWPRERVALPTYPWQRRRVWPDLPEFPGQREAAADWLVAPSYEPRPPTIGAVGGIWVVRGSGPLADRIRRALADRGARLTERPEPADEVAGVVVAPAVPDGIGADPTAPALALLEAVRDLGESDAKLTVVTCGAVGAEGAAVQPLAATLWGLGRVVRAERPDLSPVLVDVDEASDDTALVDAIAATDREPEVIVRAGRRLVGRLVRARFAAPIPDTSDGVVWITGGLSGLGLEAAHWLAEHGAKRLVLTGRSAPSPTAAARLRGLSEAGVEVVVERADVADAAAVERIAAGIRERGAPLVGVIHAAGVLADASLPRLDADAFRKVFAPKVLGAWNLHRATEGDPLRFFALFAAGAGLMGAPGQGNYAAANAFLDALAHQRRALGLPAVSIDWGTWAEVGMAARAGSLLERQAAEGMATLPLAAGLDAMGRLLAHPEPQIGVLHVDWDKLVATVHRGVCPPLLSHLAAPARERRPAATPVAEAAALPALRSALRGKPREQWDEIVELYVHDQARQILRLPPERTIDHDVPLLDLGLDSLTAVELKNAIMDGGVDLPVARVMTGPSVRQIGAMVRAVLDTEAPEPLGAPVPAPIAPSTLDASHMLSFGLGFAAMFAIVLLYLVSVAIQERAQQEASRPEAAAQPVPHPEAFDLDEEPEPAKAKGKGKGKSKAAEE